MKVCLCESACGQFIVIKALNKLSGEQVPNLSQQLASINTALCVCESLCVCVCVCNVFSSCSRASLLPEGKSGLVWGRKTTLSVQGLSECMCVYECV